jgi:hypothetical protein
VILSWNSTADTVTSDVVSAWGADGVTPTFAANWTAENTPQNLAPSNTWTRYSITATLDTASTNNVAVFIWCDDMTTTLGDFLYITDVQLEVGSLATPFERKTMQAVLADCQRYYYRWGGTVLGDIYVSAYQPASSSIIMTYRHPITMRDTPSLAQRVGSWTVINSATQPTVANVSKESYQLSVTVNAGITNANQSAAYTASTSTYVEMSAEL